MKNKIPIFAVIAGIAILCIAAADFKVSQLTNTSWLNTTDLFYVVHSGLDRNIQYEQLASNIIAGGSLINSTMGTNIAAYQALIATNGLSTGSSNITDSAYTAVVRNLLVSTNITGNGAGLTNLSGSNIVGTITVAEMDAATVIATNLYASFLGLTNGFAQTLPQVLATNYDSKFQFGSANLTNWSGVSTNAFIPLRSIGVSISGTPTTGVVGTPLIVPYAGIIRGYSIAAMGASPTCTFDVWKVASGTALPTVANTIMGTKPALSTGNAKRAITPNDWLSGTNVTAGDIFMFNLDAVSASATNVTFQLEIQP